MIVIGTTPGRENWLNDCLSSLNKPCLVLSDFSYELGKINWCKKHINKPFFFFQDSVVFKSTDWIDELFDRKKSVALTNDPSSYGMYMGIYDPIILNMVEIPKVENKAEAIKYEIEWTSKYVNYAVDVDIAFPELCDSRASGKEVRYGRECLVLENEYLIKYKGNWGQKPAID